MTLYQKALKELVFMGLGTHKDLPGLQPRTILIFLACNALMGKNKRVRLNPYQMAKLFGMSANNVCTHLRILSECGLLKKHKEEGERAQYFVATKYALCSPTVNCGMGEEDAESQVEAELRELLKRAFPEAHDDDDEYDDDYDPEEFWIAHDEESLTNMGR